MTQNIRSFHIPQDLNIMLKLIEDGFQYPENPDWEMQEDEKEIMLDMLKTMKRIWPLMRIFQLFIPFLRDMMHGFIYQEDGQPVGLINFGRERNTPEWYIGNVTVLPDYRRRGIARKLVEASLAELRRRDAKIASLEVIAENFPAYHLYEELGFEAYSSSSDHDIFLDAPVTVPELAEGFSVKRLSRYNWKTRLAFAQHITPPKIQKYEPVKPKNFKPSLVFFLLDPLISTFSGTKTKLFSIYKDETVVSIGLLRYRTRARGANSGRVQIDPEFPEVAPFALNYMLSIAQKYSPGHKLGVSIKHWQPALLQAASATGCKQRFTLHQMAKRFD